MLKIKEKILILVSISLIMVNTGFALPVKEKPVLISLEDAVLLSLRNNPTVQSAEITRVTQKYELVVARHQFVPNFTLGSDFRYDKTTQDDGTYTETAAMIPTGKMSITSVYGTQFNVESDNNLSKDNKFDSKLKFEVIQPLLKGFGRDVVEATLRNAYDSQVIYTLNLKNTLISTITSVINNYMNLVQSKETLKVDQATYENYKQILKNDNALIAAGRMATTEIMQPQAQLARQDANIQSDINNIKLARLRLLRDLGLDSQTQMDVPEKIDFTQIINKLKGGTELPGLPEAKSMALNNNPNYLVEGITLRSLARNLITAKNQERWQLDLSANRSHGIGPADQGVSDGVNLRLGIPINDVNAKQGVIQAKAAIDKALIGYRDQRRGLENDIEDAISSINSAKQQLYFSEQEFQLRQKYRSIAQAKYDAGRITMFELLQNQTDLASAQQSVISNNINYINRLADFDSKLGLTLQRWNINWKNDYRQLVN